MHVEMETISPTSSYRTVPDLNAGSESEGSTVGSRPSSPVEYETTTTTRHGTALVLEKPTLVSFVPTSEIQTAVSITRDRVIIDTILPPTATLARSTPRAAALQSEHAPLGKEEGEAVLQRHQAELYELLAKKFTANYDPTGKIRDDVFTTLTTLTRFPDPPGLKTASGEDGCPCICCELGCDHPLEPNTQQETERSERSTHLTQEAGQEELHSFLEMDKPRFGRPVRSLSLRALAGASDRDGDKRSGGFWAFGRSNRSSSQSEFSQSTQTTSSSAQGSSPPPRAANGAAEVGRSRSLSDLVRRRRSKHIATTSAPPPRTDHREAVVLPARTSSHAELRIRAETPQETPQPPPRRSSKRYAIVSRKPVPPLYPTASQSDPALHATLARSGTTAYAIDRIVEEDEDEETLSRRHSALMSSFHAHPDPWSQPLHTPTSTTHVGVAI